MQNTKGVLMLFCGLHEILRPCGIISSLTKFSIILKWKAILNQEKVTFITDG